MAKFQAIIGNVRGSLAGTVYSHNKGGDYIRQRSSPTNPSTARQLEIRAILSTYSAAWASLTDEQRNAWNTWAEENPLTGPLGESYAMSGHQAFISLNSHLFDADKTTINVPPPVPGPAMLTSFSVSFTSGTSVSVVFSPDMGTNENLMVWMSNPHDAGANPNFDQAVLVGYSAENVTSPCGMMLPRVVGDTEYVNFYGSRMDQYGQVSVVKYKRQQYNAT